MTSYAFQKKARYNGLGNVGIGTDKPQAKLDVSGNVKITGHVLPGSNITYDLGSSDYRWNDIYLSGNTIDLGGTKLSRHTDGSLMIKDSMDNMMTGRFGDVTTTGNIGVGTDNPSYKLHVIGDTRIQGNLTVNGTTTMIDTDVQVTDMIDVINDGTGPALRVTQTGVEPIADFCDDSSGNVVVRIADNGNVGIGTLTPKCKLHVMGDVSANNFLGKLKWTDVSGAPPYELAPGSVIVYDGSMPIDDSFIPVTGQTLNRSDYPELANALGIPNDQPTFTMPSPSEYQPNWNDNNVSSSTYIRNKPNIFGDVSGNVGIGTSMMNAGLQINTTVRVNDSVIRAYPPVALTGYLTDVSGSSYGRGKYVTSSSSEFSASYPSWYGFDKNYVNYWVSVGARYTTISPYGYSGTSNTIDSSGNIYYGEWIQLQLPVSTVISSYTITCNGTPAAPKLFYLLGSINGINWLLLNTQNNTSWTSYGQSINFSVLTSFSFSYYRIVTNEVFGNGGYVQLQELILNGTEESLNVNSDGKVGIGIRNPNEMFEVAGNGIFNGYISAGNLGMFRNRIINGDMRFAQRGTSVNGTAGAGKLYRAVDRYYDWNSYTTYNVTFSQQTDAPPGFQFSHRVLCTGTMLGGSYLISGQAIEGYNMADFMWGTTYAQPAILSFWIKQNKTGTFSVTFENEIEQYIYISTYTIYSAGVWEYKTISIPPPTTGTWNNTNGTGVFIHLISQTPSVYSSVPFSPNWRTRTEMGGGWAAQITGTGTAIQSANDYVMYTGLQLEKGTIATPFEFRPYGIELQLCQRYCEKIVRGVWGFNNSTTSGTNYGTYPFKVTKRDTPVASGGATYSSYYQLHPDFAIVQRDNSTPDIQNVFFTAEL
jgi:hypothetical protein